MSSDQNCAPPGPGAQHKKLDPFVGTFRAEVKLWMGPGDPMVMTGTMTNTWILGGRYLQQDYKGDPHDGPFPAFEGRGYWGYNDAANRYEGFWIDNASNIMMTERGTLGSDDRTWTMSGEYTSPMDGSTVQKRSVIRLKDKDHHSMESFAVGPDAKESKSMEITYVRA